MGPVRGIATAPHFMALVTWQQDCQRWEPLGCPLYGSNDPMPESVDDHIGMEVTHQAEVVARDYPASARHRIVLSARISHVITPTTSVSDSLTTGQSDPSQPVLQSET